MQATFKVIQKSLQAAGSSLQALLYGKQHSAQEAWTPPMLPPRARIKPAIEKRGREVKTLQEPRLGACTVKWKMLYLEYAPSRFRPNFAHSWTRNMSHFQYGASWHGRLRVNEILATCLDGTKNINHMIGVFGLVRAGWAV